MFCRNCGTQLDDQAVACIKCGANPRVGVSYCWHCGKPTTPAAVVCVNCGVAFSSMTHNPRAGNKIAAGVCGILLGWLGVHKFILGYTTAGVIMLLVGVVGGFVTCGVSTGVMGIIGIIEGIIYLTKSDDEFVRTYVEGKRAWF